MLENYCDLNTFLRKPLTFKGLNKVDKDGKVVEGTTFVIPGQIPVKFMMELSKYIKTQDSVAKGEVTSTDEEVVSDIKNLVLDILNLDKAHKYTLKDVDENFDDLVILQALIKEVTNYVYMIEADPNCSSPVSK